MAQDQGLDKGTCNSRSEKRSRPCPTLHTSTSSVSKPLYPFQGILIPMSSFFLNGYHHLLISTTSLYVAGTSTGLEKIKVGGFFMETPSASQNQKGELRQVPLRPFHCETLRWKVVSSTEEGKRSVMKQHFLSHNQAGPLGQGGIHWLDFY
jgi:hypothetical protein